MKRTIGWILLLFGVWTAVPARTVPIPYVTAAYGWETGLIVDNAGFVDATIELTLFTDGTAAAPQIHEVAAGQCLRIPLTEGSCGTVTCAESNVVLKLAFRHTIEEGIAEFALAEDAGTRLQFLLPHYAGGIVNWTGLAVMNPGEAPAAVALEAYAPSGASLGVVEHVIGGRDLLVQMLADFFPGLSLPGVARIEVRSDVPVCGLHISGHDLARLLFTPAVSGNGGGENRPLPHVTAGSADTWANWLVLDNPDGVPAAVTLRLFHQGQPVAVEPVTVAPGESRAIDLTAFADPPADSGCLTGCPAGLLARLAYVATADGGTAEFLLTQAPAGEWVFSLPTYAAGGLDWTGLALYNAAGEPVSAILKAYRGGAEIDRVLVDIPPDTPYVRLLEFIFPHLVESGIDRIVARADGAVTGIHMSGQGLARLLFTEAAPHRETRPFLERLMALPGVVVTPVTPPAPYPAAYEIRVTQPLDHQNPGGETFIQRIWLNHLGEDRPMVMYLGGYGIGRNLVTELCGLLDANELVVPHRFFAGAAPADLDWEKLNIVQAAADHHRLAALFQDLYPGRWVNTGGSKGGMTALFHRRFHPRDVDVTVAYVAPLMLALEDPRPTDMIQGLGTVECRDRIWAFQRRALQNRSAIAARLSTWAAQTGRTYHRIGFNAAVEHAVMEHPFAFWQYGPSDCNTIPGPGASAATMFAHLAETVGFDYYSDQGIAYFEPAFYQFLTETGYCRYLHEHLDDLLVYVPDPDYSVFAPMDTPLPYRPEAMTDILGWLQTEGDRILYIYGGWDPWTACAVELTGEAVALKIIQPGADHGIRISGLDDRELVLATLSAWLGMDVPAAAAKARPWPAPAEEAALETPFRRGRLSAPGP